MCVGGLFGLFTFYKFVIRERSANVPHVLYGFLLGEFQEHCLTHQPVTIMNLSCSTCIMQRISEWLQPLMIMSPFFLLTIIFNKKHYAGEMNRNLSLEMNTEHLTVNSNYKIKNLKKAACITYFILFSYRTKCINHVMVFINCSGHGSEKKNTVSPGVSPVRSRVATYL